MNFLFVTFLLWPSFYDLHDLPFLTFFFWPSFLWPFFYALPFMTFTTLLSWPSFYALPFCDLSFMPFLLWPSRPSFYDLSFMTLESISWLTIITYSLYDFLPFLVRVKTSMDYDEGFCEATVRSYTDGQWPTFPSEMGELTYTITTNLHSAAV